MLPENEYSEIESRYYLNPQVGPDESNKFIENLRSTQQQNTAQIAKDTAALGTEVSSNLGGLGGPESYFTSRYAVPQTNSVVANLRAAAQATALNQVLENEQAIWKKRYQDSYRNYQKRANRSGGGGGSNLQSPDAATKEPDVETTTTTTEVQVFPEALSLSMYKTKWYNYVKQGMTAQEAEDQVKKDLGLTDEAANRVKQAMGLSK